ncbi:MAG TPA: Tim44/TimA family putative adaptor protein [Stellaceae bacterium]|nr:Tim44/TimA family putative adaptor protein [Stellaceae bacterium]
MDGLGQYFDIILFAMIAGFLVLRLRSILGRRTGFERDRHRDFFARRPGAAPGKVTAVREHGKPGLLPVQVLPPADTVATGIEAVRRADPGFDPGRFVAGARSAFTLIVEAFARGDTAALRPLLGEEVYRAFATAIENRRAAGETLETRILRIEDVDITRAGLDGHTARVTVKFVSEQINVTRASEGSVVDGDPEHSSEKIDIWTFARDTRSADPNWALVATGA